MKDLIKDIKYNRLPKETLHLISLLNDKNNYVLYQGDYLIKSGGYYSGNILFCFNTETELIHSYENNIRFYLIYKFLKLNDYRITEIEHIIKETIKNCKYSHYRSRII